MRTAAQLLQRRGQPFRPPRVHRTRGVGQILATPRQGKVNQLRQDRRQNDEHDRHEHQNGLRAAAAPVAVARAARSAAKPHGPRADVRQNDDGPQHDPGRGHQRHVAILDVADLVRDDSLQLVPIENLEQTDGDGHGGLVGVAADGKGIGRRIIDDEHAGHLGQLRRDRHLFHDVEQLRMVLLLDLARTGHLQQDVVALLGW